MDFASLAIDQSYALYGKAATFTPRAGAPAACSVILDRKDVELGGLHGGAMLEGRVLEVRKSEIAAPAKGATFTLADTGEVLKVLDDPRCDDPDRLVWTMTVR